MLYTSDVGALLTKIIVKGRALVYLVGNFKTRAMKQLYFLLLVLMIVPCTGTSQTMEMINKPLMDGLDEVAPFSEGLAAIRKGNQWGFINEKGELVIDFRNDVVWDQYADTSKKTVKGIRYPQFKNGLCPIQETREEEIPFYGFMDTQGRIVIQPEYLNITEFDNGVAVGIYCNRAFRGKNKFQLNIYEYSFTEALVNTKGEIVWPIGERDGILMVKRRYQIPELRANLLSPGLIAVKNTLNKWEVRKVTAKIGSNEQIKG